MSLRVRKKKNKSGSISIQIVDRSNRGYKVVESLGYSKDEIEIEILYKKALKRIRIDESHRVRSQIHSIPPLKTSNSQYKKLLHYLIPK